ncbi:hypothetical protein [Pseudoxanthomonas mexicana]|uniref:hypothetical protein n=1 Tax=Pseudoxanthomonas mexicana TaxID=128785 RepID=UPI00398B53BC
MSVRRHPLLCLLRAPALYALMLAVLAMPMLAALGDVHEAGQGMGHAHDGEHASHPAPEGGHGDGQGGEHGEERSLLHLLVHASHCCGVLSFIAPDAPPQWHGVVIQVLQTPAVEIWRSLRLDEVFRPPIAA